MSPPRNTRAYSSLRAEDTPETTQRKQNYTIFHSEKNLATSRKNWLSGFLNAKGEVVVNSCARDALLSKKISLLPIGVTKIIGQFEKGEAIFIKDEDGNHIASGISNYSSSDAKKIIGKNSKEVKEIFGKVKVEIIHMENMAVSYTHWKLPTN